MTIDTEGQMMGTGYTTEWSVAQYVTERVPRSVAIRHGSGHTDRQTRASRADRKGDRQRACPGRDAMAMVVADRGSTHHRGPPGCVPVRCVQDTRPYAHPGIHCPRAGIRDTCTTVDADPTSIGTH